MNKYGRLQNQRLKLLRKFQTSLDSHIEKVSIPNKLYQTKEIAIIAFALKKNGSLQICINYWILCAMVKRGFCLVCRTDDFRKTFGKILVFPSQAASSSFREAEKGSIDHNKAALMSHHVHMRTIVFRIIACLGSVAAEAGRYTVFAIPATCPSGHQQRQ